MTYPQTHPIHSIQQLMGFSRFFKLLSKTSMPSNEHSFGSDFVSHGRFEEDYRMKCLG